LVKEVATEWKNLVYMVLKKVVLRQW
jgi:hypothetical protein